MEFHKQFNIVQIVPYIKKLIFTKKLINDFKNKTVDVTDIITKKYIKIHYIFTKELLIESLNDGFFYKYKINNIIYNSQTYKINKFINYEIDNINKYLNDIDNILFSIKQHILTFELFEPIDILNEY